MGKSKARPRISTVWTACGHKFRAGRSNVIGGQLGAFAIKQVHRRGRMVMKFTQGHVISKSTMTRAQRTYAAHVRRKAPDGGACVYVPHNCATAGGAFLVNSAKNTGRAPNVQLYNLPNGMPAYRQIVDVLVGELVAVGWGSAHRFGDAAEATPVVVPSNCTACSVHGCPIGWYKTGRYASQAHSAAHHRHL